MPEQPGYIQDIEDDLHARKDWASRDAEIMKRRMGERKKSSKKPYPNAPNFVVPIIDDTVREKTDQEITMILNAPRIANFFPVDPNTPINLVETAEVMFDTYLRHVIRFRQKKEEAVDCKNARGFAITKVVRTEDPRWGTVPDFVTVDLKDVIVPVDMRAQDVRDAERLTFVLRMSKKKLKDRMENGGWNKKAVGKLLKRVNAKGTGEQNAEDKGIDSTYQDEEHSAIKATEKLAGINVSDYAQDNIVVWEIMHYATKWDVDNDPKKVIKKGRKCMAYISPDEPDLLLHIKPWKEPDTVKQLSQIEAVRENLAALNTGEETQVKTQQDGISFVEIEGSDRPWPVIQHRYEYRSTLWYDSRGIGHLCRDNQIYATGVQNAKGVWLDYSKNFMLEQDPSAPANQQNVKFAPGSRLPPGSKIAQIPQPPSNFDFDIDAQKREAATRAGAGSSLFSERISETRKVEKTKAEVVSTDAKQATLTSASVDRFNDPDVELFALLWEDLRRLAPQLPLIENGSAAGSVDPSVYKLDFLIVPAASSKTANPDLQFVKDREAVMFAAQFMQQMPVDIQKGVMHAMTRHDPFLAKKMVFDPAQEGPQGQPPIYQILAQVTQMLQQVGQQGQQRDQQIEGVQKLAVENSQRGDQLDENLVAARSAASGKNGDSAGS